MPVRATKRGAERTPLDREVDVLICGASFAGLTVAQCAERLGRTPAAVRIRPQPAQLCACEPKNLPIVQPLGAERVRVALDVVVQSRRDAAQVRMSVDHRQHLPLVREQVEQRRMILVDRGERVVVELRHQQAKPRSKVLVLDANPDVTSKGPLFKRAWDDLYKGIIEYRGNAKVIAVERGAVRTDFDTIRGDVLNVVPPHRAADLAQKAGLITTNNRWCDVDWRTMESKAVKGVHVLGDATLSAPAMPKSAGDRSRARMTTETSPTRRMLICPDSGSFTGSPALPELVHGLDVACVVVDRLPPVAGCAATTHLGQRAGR